MDSWLTWALPFVRALAMLTLIPFALSPVPLNVRITLALFLGFAAIPAVSVPSAGIDTFGLLGLIVGEVVAGVVMGFSVAIVYQIAIAAGGMISAEMSLTQSNIFNPSTNQRDPIMAVPLGQLVTLLIFATGAHYHILYAYIRSFAIAPPGRIIPDEASMVFLIGQTSKIFMISAQMAAPFIAGNFIVIFAFSILGRSVPSINVFMLSFPVRILVGFILLGTTAALMARYLMHPAEETPERMLRALPAATLQAR